MSKIPEGLRLYVVGDIHGRADLLIELKELIAVDQEKHPARDARTVFLGDYIDRGADTKGVLEILSSQPFPTELIPLRGNHEAMLLTFLSRHEAGRLWIQNGGLETLRSYGVDVSRVRFGRGLHEAAVHFKAVLPTAHLKFLQDLRLSFTAGDYFFCHAGIRPGIPLMQQREEDLLWIRAKFLTSTRQHEKVVVHGHTPVQEPELTLYRINLDTGAYMTGRLTCLVLEGTTKRLLVATPTGANRISFPQEE
ncbi:metallophosphoesterase family protein [Microvirga sp. TS319]|uniref:metallophosphoesterase family protein n=1 Tax=Microvirga sp. TS319 TaxID=3241165 RepID=UPI00351A3CDD